MGYKGEGRGKSEERRKVNGYMYKVKGRVMQRAE